MEWRWLSPIEGTMDDESNSNMGTEDEADVGACGNCYDWDYAPATLNGVQYCMCCGADEGDSPPVVGDSDGRIYVGIDLASGPSQTVEVLVEVQPNGHRRVIDITTRGLR